MYPPATEHKKIQNKTNTPLTHWGITPNPKDWSVAHKVPLGIKICYLRIYANIHQQTQLDENMHTIFTILSGNKLYKYCLSKPATPEQSRTNTRIKQTVPFLNKTQSLYRRLTDWGHVALTPLLNSSSQPKATEHAAPPKPHIPEDKQRLPAILFVRDRHALGPWDVHGFLLTLPFVEPQHTASEHRHGGGHGGGERGGGAMDCGWWPSRRRWRGWRCWCEGLGVGRGGWMETDGQVEEQRWRKGEEG